MALSPATKEKIEKLKIAARKARSKLLGGAKGTGLAVGVGVACAALQEQRGKPPDDPENPPTWKKRWLAPIGLIIGGHFVKRRQYDAGTAMAACGGFIGYLDYVEMKAAEGKGIGTGMDSGWQGNASFRGGADAGWDTLDRPGDAGGAVQCAPTTSPTTSTTRELPMRMAANDWENVTEAMALVD